MQHRVKRALLLQQLEAVQPGLSPRDIVEQSSCFVFKGGQVITFNDEVACQAPSHLPAAFTGAVTAKPLLALLSKLPDEDITISEADGHMVMDIKGGDSGVKMDSEITLPVDTLELPKKWKPIPKLFDEAISIVHECASKDESNFGLTCIHIHPKWIEACDDTQLTRFRIKTGLAEPILVKREALKPITALGMTKLSETSEWIHFKNPSGLVYSCRRYIEEYPSLLPLIKMEGGSPSLLPKGLSAASEIAGIFSSENEDDDQVTIEIRPGKMRIVGRGDSGYHRKRFKIRYEGPNLSFRISPKLLIEIVKRHNEVLITNERLKVDGGRWVYVTCLGDLEEKTSGKQKGKEEAEEAGEGDAEGGEEGSEE